MMIQPPNIIINQSASINYSNVEYESYFFCLKRHAKGSSLKKQRTLYVQKPDWELLSNKVSTSKYTLFTFLPKMLIYQFSKLANIYFLLIGLMQCIPQITISGGKPVMFLPFSVILSISALKEIFEDKKRKDQDKLENNHLVVQREAASLKQLSSEQLHPGHVIKISNNEQIPADVFLLQSSEENGVCYVETMNLDGETNLKLKLVTRDIQQLSWDKRMKVQINYEAPNRYLHQFNGQVSFDNRWSVGVKAANVLLRGSTLKNTEYVFGLVIYTGHETKIMMNSIEPSPKLSSLERSMNRMIVIIFTLQLLICVATSAAHCLWTIHRENQLPYLDYTDDVGNIDTVLANIGTWLLIFTNFIPISLLVTLEIVKFYQGYLLQNNENGGISVQSSSLNEELGQIHHVFSDKTGTLTLNKMEFKHICVNGVSYGHPAERRKRTDFVDFQDPQFMELLKKESALEVQAMLCIGLCHNVVVEECKKKAADGMLNKADEEQECKSKNANKMIEDEKSSQFYQKCHYNAASPDELALVYFAKQCGFVFEGSKKYQGKEFYRLSQQGKIIDYEVLQYFEFDSFRKRVSIVLLTPEGNILLLCKGADSVIESLLTEEERRGRNLAGCKSAAGQYGSSGLRTLFLAARNISQEEYSAWVVLYEAAERQLVDREEALERCRAQLERQLQLLGVTAVEDRLQDEVATTIGQIREAGIRFWVLTGDKQETAISVSIAASIIEQDWRLHVLDATTVTLLYQQLSAAKRAITDSPMIKHGLILQGECFHILEHSIAALELNNSSVAKEFIDVALMAHSVIGCRFSPSQKKQVVSLVRKYHSKASTLAIGDGANDVSMILEAHVGIGVKGVEGSQASRASDYSVSQFSELRELLFDFGRECYRKNSELVLFNFYKNLLLVLPQWWYGACVGGLSGTTTYDPWIYQLFNTIFTALPIMMYAVIDRQHSRRTLLAQSWFYYAQGIHGELFNLNTFARTLLNGAFQSLVITSVVFLCLENISISDGGRMSFFELTGMTALFVVTLQANIKVLIFTHTFKAFSFIAVFVSITAYLFCYLVITSPDFARLSPLYNTFSLAFGNIHILLTVLVTTTLLSLLDLSYQQFRHFAYHRALLEYSKMPLKLSSEVQTEALSSSKLSSNIIGLELMKGKSAQTSHGYAKMSYSFDL